MKFFLYIDKTNQVGITLIVDKKLETFFFLHFCKRTLNCVLDLLIGHLLIIICQTRIRNAPGHCVFCHNMKEDMDHILRVCPREKEIWSKFNFNIRLDTPFKTWVQKYDLIF